MPTAEPFVRDASWSCDNCGESFDDYHEAVEHEGECKEKDPVTVDLGYGGEPCGDLDEEGS